jgi:hypothetical protein
MSGILEEIARGVSFNCAVRLSAAHGGSTIWIPTLENASPTCGLAALLGWDDFCSLSEKYGGTTIAISGMDDFARLRAASISSRLSDAGLGNGDIAQIIGTTTRRVSSLINEGKKYLPMLAISNGIRGLKRLAAGPEGMSIRSNTSEHTKENAK